MCYVLEQLSKSFKKQMAVQDLNIEVQKGEVFVLLGPTGAGKTTTLPTHFFRFGKHQTSGRTFQQ